MSTDPQPPGQERPYPEPTKTGTIPFEYPSTGLKGETYYLVFGDLSSGKRPLICLHGGPGAGHNYILPISLISKDYDIPVVMYDQVGCGKSTHFPDKKNDGEFWKPEVFMDEFENLCSYLKITEYDLLGQSWGGMLAGSYAIDRQPKGLNKIIISDSPADMITWVSTANRLRKELPKDVQETLTRCEEEEKTDTPEYEEAMMVFLNRYCCRLNPWPEEANATMGNLSDPTQTTYMTMNGPSEFHVIGTLKTWDIREGLKKITSETAPGGLLVMNGYYDEAQDETCVAYWTNPTCRTKWVRYGLSSHMPMLEETEKYIKDLGIFLTAE
ncbi:hypothetical protein LTR56_023114 [Elasticomyces elasticus]|nr:hypothetical protein LTR56_023114 [Elasticomyces elasticus]KAK3668969.1 hypothetical protein LTR22_000047 [Elasticomyces elasticus]KAK4907229.1 hypothetical protein LTR49_023740 [Elasticomyces elasticus]KAK5759189.1 hypothetical protein LTS12_010658 [Elasticomyces elasticus]